MYKVIKYLLFLTLIALAVMVKANGSVTVYSDVSSTGSPVLKNMPMVNIISEKLYIELDGAYTHVTVNYILYNNSDIDYLNENYGFPIDFMGEPGDSLQSISNLPYLKDIEFKANDRIIPHQISDKRTSSEGFVYTYSPVDEIPSKSNVSRKWVFTKIDLKKRCYLSLRVKYSVINHSVFDGSYPLNLDDLEGIPSDFVYDFSPAATMGDGIIKDFYVQIDASSLLLAGNDKYQYDTRELSPTGLAFEKNSNIYTYRKRNFDLKTCQPLIFVYSYTPPLEYMLSKRIDNNKVVIKASNEQKSYPLSNLYDLDFETAWVSTRKGTIGEWIEYTFKDKDNSPGGFIIANGYLKNEKTFLENNRVKSFRVNIKYFDDDNWYELHEHHNKYLTELLSYQYSPIYLENIVNTLSWFDLYDVGVKLTNKEENGETMMSISDAYVEKIRFTIKEIYPGTKYDDTCISEILFLK